MDAIKLRIKRISNIFDDIPLPNYATDGSAGMDVRAAVDEKIILESGKI